MPEAWNVDEVDRTIDTYFAMLRLELDGEAYSKADFRRELRTQVARSNGSVEYKLQNISAVLADLGGVFIDGYKPARNVQQLLRQRVTTRFAGESELRQRMIRAAEQPAPLADVELHEPVAPPLGITVPDNRKAPRIGKIVDFQEREARNRALGQAGEEAVLRLERRRLLACGEPKLAARVRHVSVLDGDGLGYDVLSFTPDGVERFIEVKTTRYSRELPFFVSRNEVEFSAEEADRFCLYRLFRYGDAKGGYYELPGALSSSADLTPEFYRGLPSG